MTWKACESSCLGLTLGASDSASLGYPSTCFVNRSPGKAGAGSLGAVLGDSLVQSMLLLVSKGTEVRKSRLCSFQSEERVKGSGERDDGDSQAGNESHRDEAGTGWSPGPQCPR